MQFMCSEIKKIEQEIEDNKETLKKLRKSKKGTSIYTELLSTQKQQ